MNVGKCSYDLTLLGLERPLLLAIDGEEESVEHANMNCSESNVPPWCNHRYKCPVYGATLHEGRG